MAHLDDQALSAHLDGDADHGAHLGGCAACVDRLRELRAVASALSAPPPTLDRARAEAIIGTALEAAGSSSGGGPGPTSTGTGTGTVVTLADRRRKATRWLAVAAVALMALAAVPLLTADRDGRDGDAALRSDSMEAQAADSGAGGGSSAQEFSTGRDSADTASGATSEAAGLAAGPISDGDLGPRSEVADVGRAARARLDSPTGGDDTGPPVVARCEPDARAGDPALGELVYIATLTWRGTSAEALVFRLDAPDGYHLEIMARSGCAPLARARI